MVYRGSNLRFERKKEREKKEKKKIRLISEDLEGVKELNDVSPKIVVSRGEGRGEGGGEGRSARCIRASFFFRASERKGEGRSHLAPLDFDLGTNMAAVISSLRGRGTCDTIVVAMGVVQTRNGGLFGGSVHPLTEKEGPSAQGRGGQCW